MRCFDCKHCIACASYFGIDMPVTSKAVEEICRVMGGFKKK